MIIDVLNNIDGKGSISVEKNANGLWYIAHKRDTGNDDDDDGQNQTESPTLMNIAV